MLEHLPENLRLWFLSLASSDLGRSEEAARSAAHLGNLGQFNTAHCESLIEIAVIRYARPFTNCRLPGGAARTRLPIDVVPNDDNTRQFHQMLIGIRDQSAAHSDLTVREARIELVQNGRNGVVWRGHVSSDSLSRPQVDRLADLALAIRRNLLPEINALASRMYPNAAPGDIHDITP